MSRYCDLSCDGAMSEWLTYSNGSETLPTVWRRYEYDGLNILRVDEVCDTNLSGYIDTGEETWRTIEVNTHKPGALGALIGKRVYQYSTRATTTPSSTNDYTYTYDAVGNVQVVYRASGTVGQEAYFFTQDAFRNELSGDSTTPASNRTNLLGGASWSTARTAGITEHQTGKILSSFTGLYYFNARWYDPVVGRFVGRDPRIQYRHNPSFSGSSSGDGCVSCTGGSMGIPQLEIYYHRPEFIVEYSFAQNNPTIFVDPKGSFPWRIVAYPLLYGSIIGYWFVYSPGQALVCEGYLSSLVHCVEWKLQRVLSDHEVSLVTGNIFQDHEECRECPHALEQLDDVYMRKHKADKFSGQAPHLGTGALTPRGCTPAIAEDIIELYQFPASKGRILY